MSRSVEAELAVVATEWDRAMVENDAEKIGLHMADDWTIIGSDGSLGDKTTFLGLVASGRLTHDVMETHDLQVRVYGSGGAYEGRSFREVERTSCVFVRQAGRWRCVLTHLSRIV